MHRGGIERGHRVPPSSMMICCDACWTRHAQCACETPIATENAQAPETIASEPQNLTKTVTLTMPCDRGHRSRRGRFVVREGWRLVTRSHDAVPPKGARN